ncbi:MAG: DUF808 family protein [Luteolibacter sp.]
MISGKGGTTNLGDLVLVPLALQVGSFAPWEITPLLMIGGLYLHFGGF